MEVIDRGGGGIALQMNHIISSPSPQKKKPHKKSLQMNLHRIQWSMPLFTEKKNTGCAFACCCCDAVI